MPQSNAMEPSPYTVSGSSGEDIDIGCNKEIINYISDLLSELAILAQNQGYKSLGIKLLEVQSMAKVFAALDNYHNDMRLDQP